MLFTRPLFAQHKRRAHKFGDPDLPRMKTVPRDNLLGMSRRQLCWTVIIVTIPLVVVFSKIVYKRLVLGEEKRKSFREGGLDSGYLLDNIASSNSAARNRSSAAEYLDKNKD
ncbi:hypothetical protein IWW45_003104 [Coemansia sp. RSA 485]|nr:hypothetical protein IWW45_003104 [Coemansia sp. RSA 485]